MKKICFLLLMSLSLPLMAAPTAHESISQFTHQLLTRLDELGPLYKEDPEAFYVEVEGSLAPYVDFGGFTRGVMARYYRGATPEQRLRFEQNFRAGLIRTYSKALLELGDQEIVMLAPDGTETKPDRALVEAEIRTRDGGVFPLQYNVILIDDTWKVRNLVINGINIGKQFRSQFAAQMQQQKYDLDKVIDNWDASV